MRDYFAAKVLPSLIAEVDDLDCDDIYARSSALAREAYIYADAMLAVSCAKQRPESVEAKQTLAEYYQYPESGADEWIEWRGGACPVLRRQRVEVRLRNGEQLAEEAMFFTWDYADVEDCGEEIIAYKVLP